MGFKPRRASSSPAESNEAFGLIRAMCAALSGVEETWAYGHPNFRAGKPPRTFVAFERVKERWVCAVRVGADLRDALLAEGEPYGPVPYDRAGEWIGIQADNVDRERLQILVAEAHAAILAPRVRRR